MSGRPFAEAVTPSALANVLADTVFGQAWSLRAVLALALLGLWLGWLEGSERPGSAWLLAALVAGALLASLAWAGHANAEIGVEGWIHHACDAAHLLAAGAWLGGLAPLAAVLGRLGGGPASHEARRCARIAARFGNLAAGCVGVLVATGIVNAYFLLPTPLSLVDTAYGKLLLAKILLFAAMLAIAAVNRMRLTPALGAARDDPGLAGSAARRLRRNVWIEQALGFAVILIVAALGITPPPMPMSM
jgi:putative copper resistance protein D